MCFAEGREQFDKQFRLLTNEILDLIVGFTLEAC